jgi:hypothetical protein
MYQYPSSPPIVRPVSSSQHKCQSCEYKDEQIRKLEARLNVKWSEKKDMIERLFEEKNIELEEVKKASRALQKYVNEQRELIEKLKSG